MGVGGGSVRGGVGGGSVRGGMGRGSVKGGVGGGSVRGRDQYQVGVGGISGREIGEGWG